MYYKSLLVMDIVDVQRQYTKNLKQKKKLKNMLLNI